MWHYVPPLPWDIILIATITSLVLICGTSYEYRRRKRKEKLRRYAIKRLRRKFKKKALYGEKNMKEWKELLVNDPAARGMLCRKRDDETGRQGCHGQKRSIPR